jgi:hypothetical protein
MASWEPPSSVVVLNSIKKHMGDSRATVVMVDGLHNDERFRKDVSGPWSREW